MFKSLTKESYTAEITPPRIRGRVTATLNSGIALGILIAYWIQYGALNISGNAAWRLCFSLQLVPGVIVGAIMFWRPESPRWLVQSGRDDQALLVLANLHGKGDINNEFVRAEFAEIRTIVQLENSSEAPSYLKLIIDKEFRRRTGLAMGLQCMQQLSGANIVLYYAAKVFAQTGRTGPSAALLANGISSALLLVATTSLTIMIDYYGRRKPIFLGPIAMGSCLLVVASLLVRFGAPLLTKLPRRFSSPLKTPPQEKPRWHLCSFFRCPLVRSAALYLGRIKAKSFPSLPEPEALLSPLPPITSPTSGLACIFQRL